MVVTPRFLFPRHISKLSSTNINEFKWRKSFPSVDLGIDHLFPSEPEERKQKKEALALTFNNNISININYNISISVSRVLALALTFALGLILAIT